jgi:N-acetylneuraminic acid mutarotase
MNIARMSMVVVLIAELLTACGGGGGSSTGGSAAPPPPTTYTATSGVAQKGPLILGSTVTAQELDANLSPTGKQYSYQTNSDLGTFNPNASFTSKYIGISATGYYFDEVANAVSTGPTTLNGYSDLSDVSMLNVNLLTTLAYQRVLNLISKSGMTFAAAQAQAKGEVLAAFSIHNPSSYASFSTLDLSKGTDSNHILAAISSVIVYGNTSGNVSNLIANIQSDIGTNGAITNAGTQTALLASAKAVSPAAIATNLSQKYASVGASFAPSDISDWLDQDGDGLTGKFKFRIVQATSATDFTFPSFVADPYAGTPISVSAGQLSVNGIAKSGSVTTKTGDVITVSPPASFSTGALAAYLLSGTTKIGRASFAGHDTWSLAASMQIARSSHTATPLANGAVLVVGGSSGQCSPGCVFPIVLASAELYDPAANSWTSAGSLATARDYHVATLLPNNKVLVAGGYTGHAGTATAELYNPATNSWSSAGNMATLRMQHTATLLANGKALIVGGTDGQGAYLASAELYDPVSNTWSPAGSMATGRAIHTATLLPSGKVLVAGGTTGTEPLATAELYDPVANTWASAGSMATARTNGFTATLLPGGSVLITGGNTNGGITASAEIYDPVANAWSAAHDMPIVRSFHSASLLPSGNVLVAGGTTEAHAALNPTNVATADIYNPAANTWSAAAGMVTARNNQVATRLQSGMVLVIGGSDINSSLLASCELYW